MCSKLSALEFGIFHGEDDVLGDSGTHDTTRRLEIQDAATQGHLNNPFLPGASSFAEARQLHTRSSTPTPSAAASRCSSRVDGVRAPLSSWAT